MLDSVRAAVRTAISTNPAGLKGEAIARRMGVSGSSLYRWGETDDMSLERLVQFALITGDLRPLSAVAQLCHAAVVPLPDASRGESEQTAVHVLKEFSDMMQEYAGAVTDDKMTPAELARIEKEAQEAQRAIVRLVETARSRMVQDLERHR